MIGYNLVQRGSLQALVQKCPHSNDLQIFQLRWRSNEKRKWGYWTAPDLERNITVGGRTVISYDFKSFYKFVRYFRTMDEFIEEYFTELL